MSAIPASIAARDRAEAEQRRGSDPAVSAFVSASAGSGKTKLLTDRLLRLMLAGADPARIQCLTYTRAGAAEMSVRLQQRLGAWVTMPDAALDASLRQLALEPDEELRRRARRLFAVVLDLPGGARIGTIHAFCQSLLRRFPLEASLSPHFELIDDANARAMQTAAREAMIGDAPDPARAAAIDTVATQLSLEAFSALVQQLGTVRDRLAEATAGGIDALEAAQRRVLGLDAGETEESILRGAIAAMDLPRLRRAMAALQAGMNSRLADKLPSALDWLANAPPATVADWHAWSRYFLKVDGDPCQPGWLLSAAQDKANPGLRAFLLEEQQRVCAVLDRLRPAQVARLSAALVRLAIPAIERYDRGKADADWLDYADLIERARALLRDPGAAWVMYKLDGGLDHLLLDEVQDTAPEQWLIADALTADFFTGQGARDPVAEGKPRRSVFAVGDYKQSIFSFQGADPDGFETWQRRLRDRTMQAEAAWADVTLDVSFRSTAPVLALVDAVFHDLALMGLPTGRLHHIADRADHAGRVEVWPLVPHVAPPDPAPWEAGTEYHGQTTAPQELARGLADWIARLLASATPLPSRGRALHAGDILVLVRARGAFDRTLLRELKARGVPVAGLDRMVLADQPAVADLLALCDTLLLPTDDLALASVLTSPLGHLSDDSLMALALDRHAGQTLWATLGRRAAERPDWQAAHGFLATLFARVDYVSPHALLSEALGQLGGRARLFARLGPQAGEAIDELLSVALDHAARHPPSLQGFLHWVRQAGAEVKRESEGGARELRIMTVHGAKGLEAPLVILPATTGLSDRKPTLAWPRDPQTGIAVPLWSPRRDTHDPVMQAAFADAIARERFEHYRLLYVALTRAQDRLVVCGWQPSKAKTDCWYDVIRDACASLPGVQTVPFGGVARPWEGDVLSVTSDQRAAPVPDRAAAPAAAAPAPAWMGANDGWRPVPPPAEPAHPAPLAPSRPQDGDLGPVPQADSPLAVRGAGGMRFRRGQLMHSLLQHLPALAPAARADAARGWLARPGTGLTPAAAAELVADILRLLDDPALAPLFGPGSRAEVPLTGTIATQAGDMVIGGLVDRLVELPDRILVADYKANRDPPATIADTPTLYLRQLAAYRAVLRRIFADRPVHCALVWTRAGRADWLPDELLDTHAPGSGATA